MIMQFGIGLEGVDIPAATRRGIYVCNIPDSQSCGNAQSCAEQALYLALSVLRNQPELDRSLRTGIIGYPTGRTLYKSTALIYGYGGIGQQLSKRLAAFDARIYAVTRTLPDLGESLPCQDYLDVLEGTDMYKNLARDVDIVFICCSQNASNIGLVDRQFIAALKPGAVIVNVARGGLLNYPDVLDALRSGQLHGVGTDVYHTEPFPVPADEFMSHPRVICSPHVAGVTQISYRNMAKLTADNVRRILAGVPPEGAVNASGVQADNGTVFR
jgi:phosphoglycerate dehydrogenase-like enzyme